jgi:hypothetical protein
MNTWVRAKQIGSISDAVKLTVTLLAATSGVDPDVIGRIVCSFEYDTDVVSALKQLAPTQRSYNPTTHDWPIDLLALPELLVHLAAEPLGYRPSAKLTKFAGVCGRLEELLFEPVVVPPQAIASSSKPDEFGDEFDDALFEEALLAIDVDAMVAARQGGQSSASSHGGELSKEQSLKIEQGVSSGQSKKEQADAPTRE